MGVDCLTSFAPMRRLDEAKGVHRGPRKAGFPLWLWVVLLALGGDPGAADAQSPTLRWQGREDGVSRLRFEGASQENVNLQGSLDLTHWFHLASASAGNGQAEFSHGPAGSADAFFYRAVLAPAPVARTVRAEPDATQSISTLVTREEGGTLEWVGRDGVWYRLLVPSNAVPDVVAVRMTLVTNLASMPFAGERQAAVVFRRIRLSTSPPPLANTASTLETWTVELWRGQDR
jgi:hypothetical protein